MQDAEGVPWVLFLHVEGTEYDFTNGLQLEEAGRRLAQFHVVGSSFDLEAPSLHYQGPVRDLWVRADENLQALREMLADRGLEDDLSYLKRWWEGTLTEWPPARLDALPAGWVHGDYHGRNVVFDGDRLAGLFDFDEVERGPYVYDVASGMMKFGRESRGSFSVPAERATQSIAAYNAEGALSDEERAALPLIVVLNYGPWAANYRHWRDHLGKDQAPVLSRMVSTMRVLQAEMARLGPL